MADKLRVATASLCGCFGCHMSFLDIDERILDWEEGSRVRIAAEKYEKAPIKEAVADFRITPDGDQTRLDLSFDFTPKGGVAGKAATPALKAALTKGFNQMLQDWEAAA